MAIDNVHARAVPVVHSVAKAHFERFAIFADARACPVTVAPPFSPILFALLHATAITEMAKNIDTCSFSFFNRLLYYNKIAGEYK